MAEKLIHIFKGFLDIIFPSRCIGCEIKNNILCEKCLKSISESPISLMPWIFAATSYQDEIIKKAIWLLKYKGVKILAKPLAELIYSRLPDFLKDYPSEPAKDSPWQKSEMLIIPIPLSKKRFRQRGYNQSELIGQVLSDKMSIKIMADNLVKIKDTISQVEIKDRNKRLTNIQGAFEVKNPEIVKGKITILIDDITTTGATLSEARRVLKQSGAKKVIALVVAKG